MAKQPPLPRPGTAWGLLVAGFALVSVWVELAGELPGERSALLEIRPPAGGWVEELSAVLSDAAGTWPLAAAGAVVVVALAVARRWSDAARFVTAVVVVWAVNPLLKDLFARERPGLWPSIEPVSAYSFPSGHAAGSAALVAALVMVSWRTRWRVPVVLLGAVLVALVGFSQLALGVHHPSDVLAGWLWAWAWVGLVASRRDGDEPAPREPVPRVSRRSR